MTWHDGRWWLLGVLWWPTDDVLKHRLERARVPYWLWAAARFLLTFGFVAAGAAMNRYFDGPTP